MAQAAIVATCHSATPDLFASPLNVGKEFEEPLAPALMRIVTLAQSVGADGNAVFFTGEPDEEQLAPDTCWGFKVESYDALLSANEPSDFDGLRQYLLTMLGTDLFGFHPRFSDSKPPSTLSETARASEGWMPLSQQPYSESYAHWFRQEMGSREVGRLFTDACWSSLCNPRIQQRTDRVLLPVAVQYAIGVARLCRRLSTWTLEGTPFACTVALLSADSMRAIGSATSRLSPLIDLRPPTPFNVRNEGAIRRHAELAQSEGLFLIVSAEDGLLHSIGTARSGENAPSRSMRHSFYSWLAGNGSLVFDIRPQGGIHLYGVTGLLLDHDGFEWAPSPLAWAAEMFNTFFSDHQIDDVSPNSTYRLKSSNEHASRCSQTLGDATRRLVDGHESSIFALLHESDRDGANKLAAEMLRPDIRWSASDRIGIDGMDSESLSGLLHLDGAHLISQDGHVLSISRRINARAFRDEVKIRDRRELNDLLAYIDHQRSNDKRVPFHVVPAGDSSAGKSDVHLLLLYDRLTESTLEHWTKQQEDDPQERWMGPNLKRELQKKIIDRDAPEHFVVPLDDFSDSLKVQIQSLIRDELDTNVVRYKSYELAERAMPDNGKPDKAVRAILLPRLQTETQRNKARDLAVKTVQEKLEVNIQTETVRLHREEFPYDSERLRQEPRWPDGVAYDEDTSSVFIEESVVDRRMDGERLSTDPTGNGDRLLDVVRQQLLAWRSLGEVAAAQVPGTGGRAAIELSRQLPSSLVVKVSASGGFKLFKSGQQLRQ